MLHVGAREHAFRADHRLSDRKCMTTRTCFMVRRGSSRAPVATVEESTLDFPSGGRNL